MPRKTRKTISPHLVEMIHQAADKGEMLVLEQHDVAYLAEALPRPPSGFQGWASYHVTMRPKAWPKSWYEPIDYRTNEYRALEILCEAFEEGLGVDAAVQRVLASYIYAERKSVNNIIKRHPRLKYYKKLAKYPFTGKSAELTRNIYLEAARAVLPNKRLSITSKEVAKRLRKR